MKLTKVFFILIIISLLTFGCSQEQKSDEELRKEVLAEMETKQAQGLDVRDQEAVYSFITSKYGEKYSKKSFDEWDAYYFDFTGDGYDDVTYTAVYAEGNLDSAIFITGEGGEYSVIPSNIHFAKYENSVAYEYGFITVTQKAGGSGIHFIDKSFYVYDGREIIDTGTSLVMEDVFSAPDGYIIIGEIQGSLNDFTHTLNKTDIATEKTSLIGKSRYVYDESTMSFTRDIIYVELSVFMTKDQVIDTLGNDFTLKDGYNDMDDLKLLILEYPGILFEYSYYEEELPSNNFPSYIMSSSNKYRFQTDVEIGDTALEAIAKCEKKFENVENYHGEGVVPDLFWYQEDKSDMEYGMSFRYNTGERDFEKEEFTDKIIVESIIFTDKVN